MNLERLTPRLASIDIVRGAVMVLMAIDHVRVYSGVPAGGPTLGVFFTRWVTHFCAPAFVFLAGTSAYLYGVSLAGRSSGAPGSTSALSRYLATRGLLLVLLELTVIRASWTFNVDYSQFILAGVIWMLGWCMVLLAGMVWLPTWAIGTFGLIVIVFQDALGPLGNAMPASWLVCALEGRRPARLASISLEPRITRTARIAQETGSRATDYTDNTDQVYELALGGRAAVITLAVFAFLMRSMQAQVRFQF